MQDGPSGFEARWNETPEEKDARERHDLLPAFKNEFPDANRHERREAAAKLRAEMKRMMKQEQPT